MKTYMKYGVVIGVIFGIQSLIVAMLEFDANMFAPVNIFSSSAFLAPIIGLFLGLKKISGTERSGAMTIKDAFVFGMLIVLVAGLVNAVFFFISLDLINTDYVERYTEFRRNTMEAAGSTEQEIQDEIDNMKLFFGTALKYVTAIIPFLFIGIVFSPLYWFILNKSKQ